MSRYREKYRGIAYEIRDSYVGFPGFATAIVGTFEGGDRHVINAETYEELTQEIDAYLDAKKVLKAGSSGVATGQTDADTH